MTRDKMKRKIIDIIEDDLDIRVSDDTGLYLPQESLEKVADKIIDQFSDVILEGGFDD